ncbi:uncharacterized protein LOC116418847 [Piliocolobus tephrosceles]|uniref:uncharacterized protein LOC116418847 n=1 Tax=Piliocolobus tephrosceles TaxID=591936 RepID=UPI001300DB0C|nr:uncharacterized protein LOC116418847 [Piliocolobus tephrosceles]
MQNGLSRAYFPSVWAAKDSQGRRLSGPRPGTGRNDSPRALLPRSPARRPSKANLHTLGQLKLSRRCREPRLGRADQQRLHPRIRPRRGSGTSRSGRAQGLGEVRPGKTKLEGLGKGRSRKCTRGCVEGDGGGATFEAGTAGPAPQRVRALGSQRPGFARSGCGTRTGKQDGHGKAFLPLLLSASPVKGSC